MSFPSGDGIIVAGDVVFRVHVDRLARHSAVLAGELERAAAAAAAARGTECECVDGCAVVRVGESAEDVKAALRVVYGRLE